MLNAALLQMVRGLCVCTCVVHIGEPYKTAEPIEVPFGAWTRVTQGTTFYLRPQIPVGVGSFIWEGGDAA